MHSSEFINNEKTAHIFSPILCLLIPGKIPFYYNDPQAGNNQSSHKMHKDLEVIHLVPLHNSPSIHKPLLYLLQLKTARALGKATDASARYEKGIKCLTIRYTSNGDPLWSI